MLHVAWDSTADAIIGREVRLWRAFSRVGLSEQGAGMEASTAATGFTSSGCGFGFYPFQMFDPRPETGQQHSDSLCCASAQYLIVLRSSFRGARGLCFGVSVAIVSMMACFFDAKGPPPASNDGTAKSGRFVYILFSGDERGPRSAHMLACINTMTSCLALLYTSRCASFGHACASAPAPAPAPECCVLGPRQEQDQHCHTLDASLKSKRCC